MAFFFKQWGKWGPTTLDFEDPVVYRECDGRKLIRCNLASGQGYHGEKVEVMRHDRKSKNGRKLDGRTWDEYPPVDHPALKREVVTG